MTNKPSLALIPSGYKASKLYSILPNNGDGDFTFSRSSVATRVNKDGLIETVGNNVPRLDYIDGGCPSLLLEPQRTNNILYSESLSPSDWVKFNAGSATTPIVTDNYAISPSGEMNASRLQMSLGGGTTSSDRTFIRQTLTSQTDYYFSVYLKSTDGTEQKLNWHFGGDDFLITVTDEWQRFELNINSNATTFAGIGLRGSLISALGIDDTVDILVYGFQAEQGSYPTSYIPTSGSAVTRNKDTVGDNVSLGDNINSSEGVLYVETSEVNITVLPKRISLNDGSISNSVFIDFRANSSNIRIFILVGGSVVYDSGNISVDPLGVNKIAIKYKANDFALWVNSVEVNSSSSGNTFPPLTLDTLSFNTGGGTLEFFGKCKDLRVYDRALTDAELQELTTI